MKSMPNLNEFFNSSDKQVPSTWEKLDGIRPCAKCEEDVDGGLWDPDTLTMMWKCSQGHENTFRVN